MSHVVIHVKVRHEIWPRFLDSGMHLGMSTLALDFAPAFSPRTTIPPPASGVYPASYPLYAMIAVEPADAFEPDGGDFANDGVATDIDALLSSTGDEAHTRPTERP